MCVWFTSCFLSYGCVCVLGLGLGFKIVHTFCLCAAAHVYSYVAFTEEVMSTIIIRHVNSFWFDIFIKGEE